MADIHYKEGQWEQAEKRLTEAVRRLRGQPQQAAKLFQRLAEVHEKLGKLDEAYRQLVEADRMGPGQLLTKLSLGENRFRAGRWREAAMHLGGLADHPDAALYPEEVADALAHAAQAEIKLRHPDRAGDLYEAALKLRGNHRPTLRALAELALERGEKEKAANFLRRIAEDSSDRMERAQVFERLGDLCLELDDEAQALEAFGEAVKAYNVPGEEQVSLLEKVLKLQRSTGANEAAAQTSALLVELVKDPKERGERRREAAVMMTERGDVREAAELLEQALVEDPQDEAALVALCELGDKLPKGFGLSEKLGRALAGLAPPNGDAGVAPPSRGAVAAARRAGPQEGTGHRHRGVRAGRHARPRKAGGARGAQRPVQRQARLRGRGDGESPPAARAGRDARRFAARAGRRLHAARAARSRALLPRGAVGAGPRHQGRGIVPGGSPVPGPEARRSVRIASSRIRTARTTWPSPRRR